MFRYPSQEPAKGAGADQAHSRRRQLQAKWVQFFLPFVSLLHFALTLFFFCYVSSLRSVPSRKRLATSSKDIAGGRCYRRRGQGPGRGPRSVVRQNRSFFSKVLNKLGRDRPKKSTQGDCFRRKYILLFFLRSLLVHAPPSSHAQHKKTHTDKCLHSASLLPQISPMESD